MIDTAALREKVLDLAIRGKLVPQDPNDEPASVLLERIRAQKLQMVKEGKLKAKDIKDDTIIFKGDDNCHYEKFADGTIKNIQNEIPFEIPDSWSWCRLGFVGSWGAGATPNRNNPAYYNGDVPWLKTGDLNDDYITEIPENITQLALERTSVRLNPMGSILIAMYGATIGKLGILTYPATTNQACCACKPLDGIEQLFLFYFLLSQRSNFINRGVGGAQPNISKEKIVATLFPIPPTSEQQLIIDKIKESFAPISTIEKSLKEIDVIKTSLKSKILELAIQGKLVAQDKNDEPASVLLERIRDEKKAQLGKKYVESYIYKGDDNCYYENNEENPIETPFVLPKNWAFSRLFNLAWLDDGEKSKGESLAYLDAKTLRGKQAPVFINEGKIVEAETNVILVDGENSGEVFEVPYRGYMGSTFKVLQVSKHIEKDFIKIILDFYKTLFKDNKTGSAIPHLNKKIFKSLVVGLPPVNEQKIIISKVKSVIEILKDED